MDRNDENFTKRDWKLLIAGFVIGLLVALFSYFLAHVDDGSAGSDGIKVCCNCEEQRRDCDSAIRFNVAPRDLPDTYTNQIADQREHEGNSEA